MDAFNTPRSQSLCCNLHDIWWIMGIHDEWSWSRSWILYKTNECFMVDELIMLNIGLTIGRSKRNLRKSFKVRMSRTEITWLQKDWMFINSRNKNTRWKSHHFTTAPWLPSSWSSYPQKPFIKTSIPCFSRNPQQNDPTDKVRRSEPPPPKRT